MVVQPKRAETENSTLDQNTLSLHFCSLYRPGNKHGNVDAMSRCPDPQECICDEVDSLENLRCGPCHKCKKRAESMGSTWALNRVDINRRCRKYRADEEVHVESTIKEFIFTIVSYLMIFLSLSWLLPDKTANIRKVKTRHPSKNQSTETQNIPDVENHTTLWCGKYSQKQVQRMQRVDQDLGIIHTWFQGGKRPPQQEVVAEGPAIRHYWAQWTLLERKEGLIYRKSYQLNAEGYNQQLLVPYCLRKEVIYDMHNTLLSGHLRGKKTRNKLLQSYNWYEVQVES